MAWQEITITRRSLYEEIWKEPMTKVSIRYGLSDVGLRKICTRLDIPIPNRGYWTKLKHGKATEKEPLPISKVPDTYTHVLSIPVIDEDFERRVSDARTNSGLIQPIKFEYEISPDGSFQTKEARQVQKLSQKLKVIDGAISVVGRTWVDMTVSPVAVDRALKLLDRFSLAIKKMGGSFRLDRSQDPIVAADRQSKAEDRCHFELHGQKYYLQLKERFKVEEIADIPEPQIQSHKNHSDLNRRPTLRPINSKKYKHTPTGYLFLTVSYLGFNSGLHKTEDTAASKIEQKLDGFLLRIEGFSLRRKIQSQIDEERAIERERRSQLWHSQKQRKDQLMKKLRTFVALARKLDRAESLRRFVSKARSHPELEAEFSKDLELMAFMADWIDPLVVKPWPEVDDVPDRDPRYS